MRPLSVLRPANILQFSDFVETVVLTTSGQAFDVPAGAGFIAFGNTANFGCLFGSTGVVWPAATSTNSSGCEINPTVRALPSTVDCTGFSVIAPAAGGILSMAFYGRGGG